MSDDKKNSEESHTVENPPANIPLSSSETTIHERKRSSSKSHHHHSHSHSSSSDHSGHTSDDDSNKSSAKSKKESSSNTKSHKKHRQSNLREEETVSQNSGDEADDVPSPTQPNPATPKCDDEKLILPPPNDPPPPTPPVAPMKDGEKPSTPKSGLRMPFHQLDSSLISGRRACSLSPVAHSRAKSMGDVITHSESAHESGSDDSSGGSGSASPRFQPGDTETMKRRRRSGIFLSLARSSSSDEEEPESSTKEKKEKENSGQKRHKKNDSVASDRNPHSRHTSHLSRHHRSSRERKKVSSYMLPIAHGWYEGLDEKGRKYYLNRRLKITQWDVPEEVMLLLPPLPQGWDERRDQAGKRYYVNMQLRKSQRGRPSPRDIQLKEMMFKNAHSTNNEGKTSMLVVTPPSPRSPVSPSP